MVIIMVEICQVRPTRHKFLNYYSPDVIFDIRADISKHLQCIVFLMHNLKLKPLTEPNLLINGNLTLKWGCLT